MKKDIIFSYAGLSKNVSINGKSQRLLQDQIQAFFNEIGYSPKSAHFALEQRSSINVSERISPDKLDSTNSSPLSVQNEKQNTQSEDEKIEYSYLLNAPREDAELLRLPSDIRNAMENFIGRLKVQQTAYLQWGLSKIDPKPRLTLNLSGPPGTGKTLSAHYFARKMNKAIMEVSYADVVSKYFGQGAKNLAALFATAKAKDAILFIDEAETLLSRRSISTDDRSDQATNSMKSQLLTLIDQTPIFCIFATNLIESYDSAFLSRMIVISFKPLDFEQRKQIWEAHIPSSLPLSPAVNSHSLADKYINLNGRQINRIVIEAALRAAIREATMVMEEDFDWAANLVLRNDLG